MIRFSNVYIKSHWGECSKCASIDKQTVIVVRQTINCLTHTMSGITIHSNVNQSYLPYPWRNHNNCPHLTVPATDVWQMLPVWLYRTVHTSVTHNTPSDRQDVSSTLSDRTRHRLRHLLFSMLPRWFDKMIPDSIWYLKIFHRITCYAWEISKA